MQSIFDLKTSSDQLESSNYGVSKDMYEQQTPTRDVTLGNFPNGAINFRWQTGGTKWWVPSRSYLRFRIKLTRGNGVDQLNSYGDDIAPIMNHCSALFQSAEFRLNDKTVSRVSDYLPQIDTLNTRLNKSKGWIDSVGESTNFWASSFQVRQEQISATGRINRDGVNSIEDRVELGFDPTTTLALDETTGLITFATGTIPDLTGIFQVFDTIVVQYTNGGGTGITGTFRFIVANVTATTLRVTGLTIAHPATVLLFSRDRAEDVSRTIAEYEVTWTPPLSIFKVEHAIPASRCELILNPQTASVYKKAVVESTQFDKNPAVGATANDYLFDIQDMYLYINTVEGSRVDNLTYYLDLEQISCQAESIAGANTFGQKNFDVSPSTKALAVAFQDTRAGTNTMFSATKFRSYNTKPTDDQTLRLSRFFINYAGVSKPQIDADPAFRPISALGVGSANYGIDRTTQRYVETLLNSGAYHDTGGSETIEEWQARGAYYLFNWSKDGNDRSTRVAVHTEFAPAAVLANARLLLFSISSQVAKVVVSNGSVTDVQLEDA